MINSSKLKNSFLVYSLLTFAFGITAAYHIVAIILPNYFPSSPVWRHSIFILISIFGLILSIRRWIWLWIPFSILTIQQMFSHGKRIYEWWILNHQIDFISIIIVFCMPIIVIFLFINFKLRIKTKL